MKKHILFFAVCTISILANAQIFKIVSLTEVKGAFYKDARVAGISPKGDYVLMTNGSNNGLKYYDFTTATLHEISNADGAGYNVQISRDGSEIIYRENNIAANHTLKNTIIRRNMFTFEKQIIAKNQADLSLMTIEHNNIALNNSDCKIFIIRNGKRSHIAPQGEDVNYIWASLSPDQKKILYYVSEMGCYVCDIDGKNSKFIGWDCRSPQWYDNQTIIAMNDQDNGRYILSSSIVAYSLDGRLQILTSPDLVAMFPYAAEGKIVFSTIQGKIYMLEVK